MWLRFTWKDSQPLTDKETKTQVLLQKHRPRILVVIVDVKMDPFGDFAGLHSDTELNSLTKEVRHCCVLFKIFKCLSNALQCKHMQSVVESGNALTRVTGKWATISNCIQMRLSVRNTSTRIWHSGHVHFNLAWKHLKSMAWLRLEYQIQYCAKVLNHPSFFTFCSESPYWCK